MKKITSMPKATLAELILFLAENETFSSVKKLKGGFTLAEVRTALREVARELAEEAAQESGAHDAQADLELSSKAREIISSLPHKESARLLAAFGLTSE